MKLCLLTETLSAGVGRHIAEVAPALAQRGHEVHIVYSPLRADPAFERAMKSHAALRCHALPMPRAIGLGDLVATARVAVHLRRYGPYDLVHAHSSKAGGYARILHVVHRAPVVYTPHAFVTMSPSLGWRARLAYGWMERVLAWATDTVICVSDFERRHALDCLKIAPRRISQVSNGIERFEMPKRAAARADLTLGDRDVAVGFIGRMDQQKAPERMIDALRPLLPSKPHVKLVMIGDGPRRVALEKATSREAWGRQILWLGAVDARRHMPAFDLLACSSDYEGFAYAFLEALHVGLPIVTTDVGGAAEAVEHGKNGFIVPVRRPAALTVALKRIIEDDRLRREMATASQVRATRYTLPVMIDALERHYAELAPQVRARSGAPRPGEAAQAETTG